MNVCVFSQQQIQELEATLYNALQQDKVCLYFTTHHKPQKPLEAIRSEVAGDSTNERSVSKNVRAVIVPCV